MTAFASSASASFIDRALRIFECDTLVATTRLELADFACDPVASQQYYYLLSTYYSADLTVLCMGVPLSPNFAMLRDYQCMYSASIDQYYNMRCFRDTEVSSFELIQQNYNDIVHEIEEKTRELQSCAVVDGNLSVPNGAIAGPHITDHFDQDFALAAVTRNATGDRHTIYYGLGRATDQLLPPYRARPELEILIVSSGRYEDVTIADLEPDGLELQPGIFLNIDTDAGAELDLVQAELSRTAGREMIVALISFELEASLSFDEDNLEAMIAFRNSGVDSLVASSVYDSLDELGFGPYEDPGAQGVIEDTFASLAGGVVPERTDMIISGGEVVCAAGAAFGLVMVAGAISPDHSKSVAVVLIGADCDVRSIADLLEAKVVERVERGWRIDRGGSP